MVLVPVAVIALAAVFPIQTVSGSLKPKPNTGKRNINTPLKNNYLNVIPHSDFKGVVRWVSHKMFECVLYMEHEFSKLWGVRLIGGGPSFSLSFILVMVILHRGNIPPGPCPVWDNG